MNKPVYIKTPLISLVVLVIFAAVIKPVQAADWQQETIEERLTQIERSIRTQSVSDLVLQVQRLQEELQGLRGKLEIQGHQLEVLNRKLSARPSSADNTSNWEDSAPFAAVDTATSQQNNTVAAPLPVVTVPQTTNYRRPTNETEAYQMAFDLLKAGQYSDAVKAFNDFLTRYPDGRYAGNAQYWLGETHYVTRNFDAAAAAFTQVIEQYPGSNKKAGATLKLGFIHHERGQSNDATTFLGQVIQEFPNTTEAKLAQQRLDIINSVRR